MQENKLNDLFKNYDPEISSEVNFIERLERNLNAVELIHQENTRALNRNRLAVVAASVAGFISGFTLSFLLPYINALLAEFIGKLTELLPQADKLSVYSPAGAWLIIGAISVFISIYTYNVSLNFRFLKDVRQGV